MKNRPKILFIISLLAFFAEGKAHAQPNPKDSEEYKTNKEVYLKATKYNDLAVAKNALYNLMVLDPQDISLMDSLAILYFEFQQFPSSLLVSRDILAKNPNNLAAMEISAVSFERLGLRDQALTAYESLYLKNNNVNTLYKIAFLQFDLGRFDESKTSADIILKDSTANELKIIFNTEGKKQQEVPMQAAVLNLKGLINKEQGNKEEARKNFQEALAKAPEFTLPKQNIKSLDE